MGIGNGDKQPNTQRDTGPPGFMMAPYPPASHQLGIT